MDRVAGGGAPPASGEGMVCLNGRILRPEEVRISPFDRGFLYGDGVFETLRAYGGVPFRLEAHLARLQAGVEALAIRGAPASGVLREWVEETLARAALAEAAVRLTLTRGVGRGGLDPAGCDSPTVFITVQPLPQRPDPFESGLAAVFLWPRHAEDRPLPSVKSTSYQRSVLAHAHLSREGAQEGFFLDQEGFVTEGSTSNVFAVRGGELWTPPADACLPGITRAEVLSIAREAGIPAREAPLPRELLLGAEEIFVTGSLRELAPVVRLAGAPIGDGRPGPMARALHRRYRERCR